MIIPNLKNSEIRYPIEFILDRYPNLPTSFKIRFILSCCYEVAPLLNDSNFDKAVDMVNLYMQGKADAEMVKTDLNYADISNENLRYLKLFSFFVRLEARFFNDNYLCDRFVMEISEILNKPKDCYPNKLVDMLNELTDLEKVLYTT